MENSKEIKEKKYFKDPAIPMTLKIIQCIFPFCVIGSGTLLSGNHFVGFWAFYVINCIIYPYIMINYTSYYTQVWKRIKLTSLSPTKDSGKLYFAIVLAIIFFFVSVITGYMGRVSSKCLNGDILLNKNLIWDQKEIKIGALEILFFR